MNIDENLAVTMGEGFFAGILIGYAVKKVVKVVGIAVGLFFTGLAYLQYQQIVNVNWSKLQAESHNVVTTLANTTTQFSNHISNLTDVNNHTTMTLPIWSFGIPLTGSVAMGFGIGFMRG